MKRVTTLFVAALVVMSMVAVGTAVAAKNGPAGNSNIAHLYLYEKNTTDWSIIDDGAWGKMKFNLAGPTFDFNFNGHGLEPNTEYSLIYYPDKTGNPWPRTDIICLGSDTANDGGNVHIANSKELNTDLPDTSVDINSGAKIWLVLSSDIDCSTCEMSGWNPTEYLFEGDLITYDDTEV